ncbi:hypothetical protein GCM10009843_11610 [Nocardioides bigeumensis]|uniref:Uncharacterized protein n=1 Tax=Nocardioides bigeumensis TaxID=433657 RepID=A0ABN2XZL8_9ACTN
MLMSSDAGFAPLLQVAKLPRIAACTIDHDGRPLNSGASPTAAQFAEAVHRSVVERSRAAGHEPTQDEERILTAWLGVGEVTRQGASSYFSGPSSLTCVGAW